MEAKMENKLCSAVAKLAQRYEDWGEANKKLGFPFGGALSWVTKGIPDSHIPTVDHVFEHECQIATYGG
jgi:hypothetical protein